MIASLSLLLAGAALSFAKPLEVRTVAALNTVAFEGAQQADTTATKAFSATAIKTSDGKCLFVNELSGDFRANLNPIQVAACDGSKGQQWDVITKGKHNDQAGKMLLVNSLTQACMNFDPRRAAGNQVIMFSCGGRADGGGAVTNSQLFTFAGGAGPLAFAPINAAGTCFTVANNALAPANCNDGDATQKFTFGASAAGSQAAGPAQATDAKTTAKAAASSAAPQASAVPAAVDTGAACGGTTFVTVTRDATSAAAAPTKAAPSSKAAAAPAASAPAANNGNIPSTNPTTPVPVSRAGGTLQPSSAAEANQRDNTAVRAFTSVSLKSKLTGQCLFIDPTAGDFRQNLIPVSVKACDGSPNEKFDLITSGKHNKDAGSTLIVSSLMNGCISFDPRRAAGDTVQMFSCGGRGDGGGETANSQQFPFKAGDTSVLIAPLNSQGKVCLEPKGAILDNGTCDGNANQEFEIVQ